ncbi:hypothetical protein X777_05385 [Ooceraea biroi]|uniref:Uncharacterized protein n=1 Tax=Ooceraea biroi TaxID=2015173 RepID=A0A026WFQ4_OOCBI|nr:hypothetical protein X777_05385 [Ooceraea biroi]
MSDSEGSIPSPCSSKKSVALDETIETMPIQQNHNDDKIEEFEKLLQSMIVSRSVSEEEDQVEQEDNANDKKIVGKSNLQSPNIFILQSKNLLNIISTCFLLCFYKSRLKIDAIKIIAKKWLLHNIFHIKFYTIS